MSERDLEYHSRRMMQEQLLARRPGQPRAQAAHGALAKLHQRRLEALVDADDRQPRAHVRAGGRMAALLN